MRPSAPRSTAAWLVAASLLLAAVAPAQEAAASREQLEQQLREQLAANEALKARINRLESLLATDVCADPAAAEAVLQEGGAAARPSE